MAGGGIMLFGCAVPISIDVVRRATLGATVLESFAVSTYALAACIGLGMGALSPAAPISGLIS